MSGIERVVIAGAGAFGTALAIVADKAGRKVTLFARNARQAETMKTAHENARHLHGVKLPDSIAITADWKSFRRVDLVILAVPSQVTRSLAARLAGKIPEGIPVITAAKGIEATTQKTQTEIVREVLPLALPAALSGPGFAKEIARGLPTAVTIAAADLDLAHALAAALATEMFRPYASDDLVGVELGGAVKNVLAIAAGIVVGRGLGESAQAALIARGLAEMMRLGAAMGARAETFMGLSGLGDLVLTATSRQSRNLYFGIALAVGRSPADLLHPAQPLVEGAHTALVATGLARKHGVDMPITAAVAAIIAGKIGVEAAIDGLVSRPLKAEND